MSIGSYGPSRGNPGTADDPYYDLRERPSIAIPLSALAADAKLTTRPGILAGWRLRDASGAAGVEASVIEVDASSTGGAQANNAALPAAAGRTTYITGFEITGAGATAGQTITITVTGILGGTKTYKLVIPAGAGVAISPLIVEFARPIPAAAQNQAITVNVPSFGAGNTDAAVTAHGFQALGSALSQAAFVADLFDGGDATGTPIASISIGPDGESWTVVGRDGPIFRVGLFIHVVQGAAQGAVWVKI